MRFYFFTEFPFLFFLKFLTCNFSYSSILEMMCHYSVSKYSSHMDLLSLTEFAWQKRLGQLQYPWAQAGQQREVFVHSSPRIQSWITTRVRGHCKKLQMCSAINAEVVARMGFLSQKRQKVQDRHLHKLWERAAQWREIGIFIAWFIWPNVAV